MLHNDNRGFDRQNWQFTLTPAAFCQQRMRMQHLKSQWQGSCNYTWELFGFRDSESTQAQFEECQRQHELWLQDIFLRYTIHNSSLLSYESNQTELTRLKNDNDLTHLKAFHIWKTDIQLSSSAQIKQNPHVCPIKLNETLRLPSYWIMTVVCFCPSPTKNTHTTHVTILVVFILSLMWNYDFLVSRNISKQRSKVWETRKTRERKRSKNPVNVMFCWRTPRGAVQPHLMTLIEY